MNNTITEKMTVRSSLLEIIKKKIDNLNRRARKLGCPESTVKVLGEFSTYARTPTGIRYTIQMSEIEVSGTAPKYEGWQFLASVERTPEGNIIRTASDLELPESYLKDKHSCDHCNTNRARKLTFIVQHDDGTMKRVGSTCIKDFLGHQSPTALARYACLMFELRELEDIEEEDLTGSGGYVPETFPVGDMLALSAAAIRRHGFYPKSAEGDCTAYFVHHIATTRKRDIVEANRPEERDWEVAQDAIHWIVQQGEENPNNSYFNNLNIFIRRGFVGFMDFGYLVSSVASFQKAEAKKVEKKDKLNAFHGTKGQREDFVLTLVRILTFEGYYGKTYLHIFENDKGSAFTWWASRFPDTDYREGDTMVVKGTVKDHNDYNGTKQTVLTRCKIMEVKEAA